MRTKVVRNYFDSYTKLLEFKEEFDKELDTWKEEMMLEHSLHYIVFDDIYIQETEPCYTLQYEFNLSGRYKYHLTYQELLDYSLIEQKNILVKVFVDTEEFKNLLLAYMEQNPDICPDKNKLILNGVTFKLYMKND